MDEISAREQKVISYLTFSLREENFALNVGMVVSILEMQNITKVPKTPEYIRGIINLRGEALSIVDTNVKLNLGITKSTNNTCILVIEANFLGTQVKFGMLVDTVQEVLEIEDENILASPSIGDKYEANLISGVVEHEDKFIMLLDINKLFDIEEVFNLNKISEEYHKKTKNKGGKK